MARKNTLLRYACLALLVLITNGCAVPKYALAFDGDGYVTLPSLRYDGSHPVTIEAYVTVADVADYSIVADTQFAGIYLKVQEPPGVWEFGVSNGGRGYRDYVHAQSDELVKVGRLTHVAGVFDGDEVRLYVNGTLQDSVTRFVGRYAQSEYAMMLGADPHPSNATERRLRGSIREVRISRTARYASDFVPPSTLGSDPDTIALYALNEGEGNLARDTSGNEHHGQINGATWVNVDR